MDDESGGGNAAKEDTVELQNGCACCSAAEELLQSVEKMMGLSQKRGAPWDHIVIEASGVAEPKEIRDNFRNCYESAPEMLKGTRLHTLVTVVDGSTFLSEFQKRNKVDQRQDLGANEFTDGNRQVVDLMCEQIECADILVLNKTDLVSSLEELDLLKETISNLAPLANILTSERGRVTLENILGAAKGGGMATLDEEQEHHKVIELVNKVHEARKQCMPKHSHDHAETLDSHDHGGKEIACTEGGDAHPHEHSHVEISQGHDHGSDHSDCSICKAGGGSHGHSHEHTHRHGKAAGREAKRFGITSFCYQRRRPFHPARLMKVIRQLPVRQQQLALADCLGGEGGRTGSSEAPAVSEGGSSVSSPMLSLIRSKGFVWLSNSHSQIFYWALAGKHFELKQYASWWQTLGEEEWPAEQKEVDEIMKDFDGEFGDHRQELVLIGVKMDEDAIVKLLDDCLLSDSELDAYRQHWTS